MAIRLGSARFVRHHDHPAGDYVVMTNLDGNEFSCGPAAHP
jgi:hypothetical protein